MNKTMLNKILSGALSSCSALDSDVTICMTSREELIDVKRYQNPVTDDGNISEQSIYASERIAKLINNFGKYSEIEECYQEVLSGIRESAMSKAKSDSVSAFNSANVATAQWYLQLSSKVKAAKRSPEK